MKFLAASQDKSVIHLLCTEFRYQGYTTFGAHSLRELEEIQRHEKCDVIVTDHMLVDGNFFDYYDQLQTLHGKDAPVAILLTSGHEKLAPEVAFAMGAYAVFHKPFKIKDLYDAVEDATYSKREGLTHRLNERVPLICRLEFKNTHEIEWTFAFSNNISFGGFFAVTSENIPDVGSEIDFKLKFSQKQVSEGRAKVMWSRKTPKDGEQMGFGLQFSEGREKYVRFLVPIINEARTRQNETSIFQKENLIPLIEQSIQLTKIKIAKSKTQFIFHSKLKDAIIMCRYPKIQQALVELLSHIANPLREVEKSQCIVEISKKKLKVVVKITAEPGGTSLDTEAVIQDIIHPIFEAHKTKLTCEFSSVGSTYSIIFTNPY